jgi:hypothetical protein
MLYEEPLKDKRSRKTMDAAEIQQQCKGLRPETAAVTGKQGKCQQDPETAYGAGSCQASSQVFRQDYKNECQDVVEKLAAANAKEEATHNWSATDVGVPATLRSFAPHQMEKEKWQYALDYSV